MQRDTFSLPLHQSVTLGLHPPPPVARMLLLISRPAEGRRLLADDLIEIRTRDVKVTSPIPLDH